MVRVIEATAEEHYRHARGLIEAYARELGIDLEFQGLAEELGALPEMYGPPRGAMLLLRDDGAWIGCAGLRPLGGQVAELKRMFVQPAHRRQGWGTLLMDALIVKARGMGYRAIRLDTIPELAAALALYRRCGFRDIPPYRFNPIPGAIFLELAI